MIINIMFNLNAVIYGLTIKSWLIICIMFILFLFYISSNDSIIITKTEQKEKFSNSINKKSNLKIYNFNTKWCGYSIRFQPEWDKFQKIIETNFNDVNAYDVKCDNDQNKQICNAFNIEGYPTVIFEKNGEQINYNGPRTSEALLDMVKKMQ